MFVTGLSVREDRDGQNVWTFNSSNRSLSNPSASETTSRNSSEGGSLFVHATAALANARRYAARETSRYYSSTDSSVSRAVAWDAAPPLRRHALLHGWDNPSVSDVSRRRHRLFNCVNNRSLLDIPDPPDWSSWHPPYTIDLRSSNSSMNASAISSETRHGSSRDYDPFLNTQGSDVNRRASDRRAESTSGSSGSVPTVVVTWENDGGASRPVMDDVGPDNESEEVTSTAAEAGSTASLGESIDADLERSTLDVETSSGSEVAASGSLSSDARNIFGGTMLVDLLSPSRPIDWDVVSSDAAAAATARRYGQLPVMPEDVDLSGPRRWRRFSRRQADNETSGRRMRRDHSYASSSASFTPSVFNDDTSSLRRADSPAGHDFIEYAEDLLSRIMESNSLDTAPSQPYRGGQGAISAASASTDSSSALHSAFQSNNDTTLNTAEEIVNRRLAYISSGNTDSSSQRQLNTSLTVSPVLGESYPGIVSQTSNAASSDAAHSQIAYESRQPTLAASWLGNSSSSSGDARTFFPQSLASRHSDWSADSSSSRQLRSSYSGQSSPAQPTVSSGTFSSRPDLLGSFAHQEITHTTDEELNLNITEESVLAISNSESVSIPSTSMQSAISLSSSVSGAAAQETTSDYVNHFASTSSYEQSMGAASLHQSAMHRINMPSPRTRTSSSGNVHPVHNNRPNCEICSSSNASVFRCFSSQERRRLPSRLSQITFDRLRSTRTPREPSVDSMRSVLCELRRRSSNANLPLVPLFESRTAAHSGINRLPTESIPPTTSTWNPASSGNESTIAEFEQRMRQVDERVSRIQLRLMEHAAWRREHMDSSRFSGLSDLRDRLRERQERMRAHLEELRTRFGRSANRSGDLRRTTGFDPLPASSTLSGFGSTGADAVGEFIGLYI